MGVKAARLGGQDDTRDERSHHPRLQQQRPHRRVAHQGLYRLFYYS